jgi:hypothetical protein
MKIREMVKETRENGKKYNIEWKKLLDMHLKRMKGITKEMTDWEKAQMHIEIFNDMLKDNAELMYACKIPIGSMAWRVGNIKSAELFAMLTGMPKVRYLETNGMWSDFKTLVIVYSMRLVIKVVSLWKNLRFT